MLLSLEREKVAPFYIHIYIYIVYEKNPFKAIRVSSVN